MGQNYERLGIEDFGKHLLRTYDLDPIYVALHRARISGAYSDDQLSRWLIAYWCYYHAGAASYLSQFEGHAFWLAMLTAAENKPERPAPTGGRWPRGSERRHFRARNAETSVVSLAAAYDPPERMVARIVAPDPVGQPLSFKTVSDRAQAHVGFGPWIGFKIADMVDRVLGVRVDFDTAAVFMFKDPEKAAMMLWEQREGHRYPEGTKPKREAILSAVTNHLTQSFKDYRAPPFGDRPVNIQEVETILCKWKSHMNGHYPLWNDVDEINAGLDEWKDTCPSVRAFADLMPKRS